MKKILIVGVGSYIGTSFEKYLTENGYYNTGSIYKVQTLDAINLKPKKEQFMGYDVIFFVAGIVHKKENRKNISQYYETNRNLAIKVAKAAKAAGVKQFMIMSSMAVYGINVGYITKTTIPKPTTHYGRSKLQADRTIWKLRDSDFIVSILRPPMVYGKDCKGNYQQLRKLALMCPVFPRIVNQRSMIYIGNLCEFIKNAIDEKRGGFFFPQNSEYICTSDMAKHIADRYGKRIILIKILGNIVKILPLEIVRKSFGSLTYDKTEIIDKYSFTKSIELTEKE